MMEWINVNEQKKIDKNNSKQRGQSDAETDHEKGEGDQDRETPEESVTISGYPEEFE